MVKVLNWLDIPVMFVTLLSVQGLCVFIYVYRVYSIAESAHGLLGQLEIEMRGMIMVSEKE